MSNNLIARLRNVQFWQADCDVRMQAAARIEELEEKLLSATMDGYDMAKHGYRDHIEELEERLQAAIDDAKEAEAYAAEMEGGVGNGG